MAKSSNGKKTHPGASLILKINQPDSYLNCDSLLDIYKVLYCLDFDFYCMHLKHPN